MKFLKFAVIVLIFLSCATVSFATAPEELFRDFHSNNNGYQDVLVDRILSTDTIVLADGKKIKLIGLKAPNAPRRPKVEYDKNGLPIENIVLPETTLEEKAFAFAHKLLFKKHVRLEFDTAKVDDNLMSIAYVFLIDGDILANSEILRYGYADLQIQPPNFKYEEQLRAAYKEARREKRGLQSN